ncbi:MAG: hypothetical protein ABEJ98_03575 [Candidatus Nanohaloarchaea archaeon]
MDLNNIKIGVIGDGETIDLIHRLIDKTRSSGFEESDDKPLEWARFPPINKEGRWSAELDVNEVLHEEKITHTDLNPVLDIEDDGKRISAMSDVIMDKIRKITDPDPEPDVIICGIPKIVNKFCGTNLSKSDIKIESSFDIEKEESQERLSSFVEDAKSSTKVKETALDLRAATKARAMERNVPIQFLSQNILEVLVGDETTNEHESKIAWNIWSAIYYKAGAYPWKLPSKDDNTIFVGVSFYEEEKLPNKPLKTAMAQVFTPVGKTLVIKGLPVESSEDRTPKMSKKGINELMSRVKEAYSTNIDNSINRMVVHKSSEFNEDEIEAFRDNLEGIQEYDLVSIKKSSDFNLLRKKSKSIYRGTATQIEKDKALLYTTGRKPLYDVYDGHAIPSPLLVRRDEGDSSMREICREIIQLTKVNYNNARFSQRLPFTLQFAKAAKKVFKEMDPSKEPKAKYRYYM